MSDFDSEDFNNKLDEMLSVLQNKGATSNRPHPTSLIVGDILEFDNTPVVNAQGEGGIIHLSGRWRVYHVEYRYICLTNIDGLYDDRMISKYEPDDLTRKYYGAYLVK